MPRNYPIAKTVNFICPYCGKDFSRTQTYLKRQSAAARYCSSNCARLYRWQPMRDQRAAKQKARNEALAASNAQRAVGFMPDELNAEIWKPVIGFEGIYSVSNLGRVRRDQSSQGNCQAGQILKQFAHKSGYLEAYLSGNSIRKICRVHAVVMAALVGPRPDKYVINHIDGDRHNNRSGNLEYVTQLENARDSVRRFQRITGKKHWARGGDSGSHKWSESLVIYIRKLRSQGLVIRQISLRTGVPMGTVGQIVSRRSWKHLP